MQLESNSRTQFKVGMNVNMRGPMITTKNRIATAKTNGTKPTPFVAPITEASVSELKTTYSMDGDCLVIRLPLHAPVISGTGKTLVVGSVGREDRKTGFGVDNKEITVSCAAFISAK